MDVSVGQVVMQLKAAVDQLDSAATQAIRAQVDAREAHGRLVGVVRGAGDQRVATSLSDMEEAAAKLGKMARLLSESSGHLIKYVNVIAPGVVSTRSASDAVLSGEQLLSDTERRARKSDAIWRKQVKQAEGTEGNLQKVEDGGKKVIEYLKQISPPGQTSTSTTARPPVPSSDRPQLDNPITSVLMAAGGLAMVAKSVWNHAAKKRSRRRENDGSKP